ncbi:hypothetical protein JCM11641_005540 [Rhodosporidiobolus odoratus]
MDAVVWPIYYRLFPAKPPTTSLQGKVFLITGGLSGIGYYTTLNLAQRGATILCGARDLIKAGAALNKLETNHPSLVNKVKLFKLDLGSFDKTREGAEQAKMAIQAAGGRLDGLVMNAARLISPYMMGEDGFELSTQTNYFSIILFVESLLPLLEQTAIETGSDVRIVLVSSNACMTVPKTWDFVDVSTLNATLADTGKDKDETPTQMTRYGVSKMLGTLYFEDLQQRLPQRRSKVLAISLNPGPTQTDGTHSMPFPFTLIVPLMFQPTAYGANNTLFALTAPEVRADATQYGGKYLEPVGRVRKVPAPPSFTTQAKKEKVKKVTREVLGKQGSVF